MSTIIESLQDRVAAVLAREDLPMRARSWLAIQLLRRYFGHEPIHRGNRRTVTIAGKPYHWREFHGRLHLVNGSAPS